ISSLNSLITDPAMRATLKRLEPVVMERLDSSREMVELVRSNNRETAMARTLAGEGKQLMDLARQHVAEMRRLGSVLLEQRTEESRDNARHTILTIIIGISIASLGLALFGFLVVNSISSPLKKITRAAGKISEGDLEVEVDE